MRKPRPAALLAAGNAQGCPVLRAFVKAHAVGPVASTSLRVASRTVNAIGGGHAVPSPDEFGECHLILISALGKSPRALISELAGAGLEWKRHAVVLIGDDARPLAPLAELGAATGLLAAVPGFEETLFIFEGSRMVLRPVRHLLNSQGIRIILVAPGARARFDAGVSLAGHVLFPMLAAAGLALASARLSRNLTDAVVEKTVQRTLRAWLRSRRRGWGTLAGGSLAAQVEALGKADIGAGAYLGDTVEAARRFMRSDGEAHRDQR